MRALQAPFVILGGIGDAKRAMSAEKLNFSQITDWIHPEQFRRCVNR